MAKLDRGVIKHDEGDYSLEGANSIIFLTGAEGPDLQEFVGKEVEIVINLQGDRIVIGSVRKILESVSKAA